MLELNQRAIVFLNIAATICEKYSAHVGDNYTLSPSDWAQLMVSDLGTDVVSHAKRLHFSDLDSELGCLSAAEFCDIVAQKLRDIAGGHGDA